jgi:hypothetical protein
MLSIPQEGDAMGWNHRREYSDDEMDWFCYTCKREGTVRLFGSDQAPEQARYVVCKDCGEESGYGWCPKCGMGGQFIKNLAGHPAEWTCPSCKTNHPLPLGFYQVPTLFQPEGPIIDLINYKPLMEYFPSERSRQLSKKASDWFSRITIGSILIFVIGFVAFILGAFFDQGMGFGTGVILMIISGAALILSALSNLLLGSVASLFRLRELWKHKRVRRRFMIRTTLLVAAAGMIVAGIASIGKWDNQAFAIGLWGGIILIVVSTFFR